MKKYFFLIALFSLSSCMMVGPDFESPNPEMPTSWQTAPPKGSQQKNLAQWWKIFGDSQLTGLITKAEKNNPDIKIAVLRIREARTSIASAVANVLPQLSLSSGLTEATRNGLKSSGSTSYSGGMNLSWELDIFGGEARNIESNIASFYATKASSAGILNSLHSEIAQTYFKWILYSQELEISKTQLELQKKSLQIARQRQEAGYVSMLDVEQALAQVANTEASIPSLETMRATTRNALATLIGCYPNDISLKLPSESVTKKMPVVPVGLPSDLLRRRPDIIQAEMNWYASTSRIGVAIAELYPKFSLTGSLSSNSGNFADWFSQNNSGWSLGGMVRWPIFSGGSIEANIERQQILNDINAETYRKTLLTAVNEVEDTLISYANAQRELKFLKEASASSQKAAEISLRLYTEGETEFITVVSAQRASLSAQNSVLTAEQNIRNYIAYLAKALGGGWTDERN